MQLTLTRSIEAVAADALYGASTIDELQEAWGMHCDEYPDESPERERLMKLFRDRLAVLQTAEKAARYLRAG